MIYRLSSWAAVESFEDGALVLNLADRVMTELSLIARDVLNLTDGTRSLQQVAEILAQAHLVPLEVMTGDVGQQYELLLQQRIVERVWLPQEKDDSDMTDLSTFPHYLCNPDIVLREEDENGGLLFNPDTNQIKVVNSTGLFIWKRLGSSQGAQAVIAAILSEFEDVPQDVVAADVQAFLDEMAQTGFIGIIEAA